MKKLFIVLFIIVIFVLAHFTLSGLARMVAEKRIENQKKFDIK